MTARKSQFKTIKKVSNLLPKKRKEILKMKVYGIAVLACVVVISGLAMVPALQKVALQLPQTAAVVSAVLTDLLNTDRTSNQLGSLTINPKLVAAAQAKADDMAAHGYFAHTSPDGHDSWYWFKQVGYDFNYAGENLAVDFAESSDVERAWMNSPSHRENILNPHYTEVGIATAVGMYQGRLTVFAVQMFGSQREASAAPAPIKVVATPENPEEIAIAQREAITEPTLDSSSSPAVLSQSASSSDAVEPAPQTVKKVAKATPKTSVLGVEKKATDTNPVAATVAQHPSTSVAPQESAQRPIGAVRGSIPWWGYLVSFPRTALFYAYLLVALIIGAAFAWLTEMEFKRHHLPHATSAAALLSLMGVLFVASQYIFFVQPVLAAVQ